MKSKATSRFWRCYSRLTRDVQKKAKGNYALFESNPWHPGLHFKKVHSSMPIYSVRISRNYRAVGVIKNDNIIWFWIGSHSDYDELLKSLR